MKQNFTVRQGALDGVEVFLSVAQHPNFRRAAAEFGVIPSAISQSYGHSRLIKLSAKPKLGSSDAFVAFMAADARSGQRQ